jgi:hypothetical protein
MAERTGFDLAFNPLIYIAKISGLYFNAPIYAPTNHCLMADEY